MKIEPVNYCVSYPKSGRTWLRVMVGYSLHRLTKSPEKEILETPSLSSQTGIEPFGWHHGGSEPDIPNNRIEDLEFESSRFNNKRILFLIRDPKDVVVSMYFQAKLRMKVYDGSLSDFIRIPKFGLEKWIAFHRLWFAHMGDASAFSILRYEEIHANPQLAVKHCLEHFGLPITDAKLLDDAVEYGSFEHMRELEKKSFFPTKALRPADPRNLDSYKTRKGQVGGYVDHLSESDVAYISETIRKLPEEWFGWYAA